MPDNDNIMDAGDFNPQPPQDDDAGRSEPIRDPLSDPQAITDPTLRDVALGSNSPKADADDSGSGDDRYRHHQSRADTALKQAEELARRNADLERQLSLQTPLMRLIEEDEEVGRIIDAKLVRARGGNVPELPKPPEQPQMPDGYNEQEAFSNPQSESYKYRKANERFLFENQKYLQSLIQSQQQQLAEREKAFSQQQQMQRQFRETQARLVRDHGLTPVEAQEFMEVMTSDESLAEENLVNYFRFLKTQNGQQRNVTRQTTIPPPPTNSRGSNVPDVNRLFNDDLYKLAGKPRR